VTGDTPEQVDQVAVFEYGQGSPWLLEQEMSYDGLKVVPEIVEGVSCQTFCASIAALTLFVPSMC
jgi:hypothetical protein